MTTPNTTRTPRTQVPSSPGRDGERGRTQPGQQSQGMVYQRPARDATAPMVPSEHRVLRFNR